MFRLPALCCKLLKPDLPPAPQPSFRDYFYLPGGGDHRRKGEGFAMAALIAKLVNNSHVRSAGAGQIPAPVIAK